MSAANSTRRRRGLTADLARALPNSVRLRTAGARQFLEFLDVRAEGRHRDGASGAPQACPVVCAAAANHDALEAACTERCFTTLGPLVGDLPVPGADYVVVNPLGPGVPNGDPYLGGAAAVAGGIKSRLTATAPVAGGLRLDIAPHSFATLAASRRFYLVSGPVSYECNPATQRLQRHDGYAVRALQPVNFGGAQTATLASGVSRLPLRLHAHQCTRRHGDAVAALHPAGGGRRAAGVLRTGADGPGRRVVISCPSGPRRSQAGVSGMLVMAALVLMSGMAAFGVSLLSSVHSRFAQELSVARAGQAAEAGLEWARYRLTQSAVPLCPAAQTLVLPATLVGYRVTVRCTATGNHAEGAATVRTWRITATGCNAAACPGAASSDYVERQVQGWVQR